LPADKLRLIRILAEELESSENIFPFEKGKTYWLPTPYDTSGAAELLMNTLKPSDTDKQFVAKCLSIAFNKIFVPLRSAKLTVWQLRPGTLPNCKFGTPDNVYVKSSTLYSHGRNP
jgi:hypothetical protein